MIPNVHSGTLYVTAIVQGVTIHLKMRLSVVPCLAPEPQPGDSLINDNRVRAALKMALDSSPPTGDPWNRRERGGVRMLQPDGSVRDYLLPIKPVDQPCSFNWEGVFTGLPGIPILAWHSHPYSPGNPSDPIPYNANATPRSNCDQFANAPPPPPGMVKTAFPGPSQHDSTATGDLPQLIVDKDNVWILEGAYPAIVVRRWKRNGTCDPLSL